MRGELLGYDPFLENVLPGIEQMAADLPCVHRWLIAEPNGSHTVPALCRLCGAEREYLAADWIDDGGFHTRVGNAKAQRAKRYVR